MGFRRVAQGLRYVSHVDCDHCGRVGPQLRLTDKINHVSDKELEGAVAQVGWDMTWRRPSQGRTFRQRQALVYCPRPECAARAAAHRLGGGPR